MYQILGVLTVSIILLGLVNTENIADGLTKAFDPPKHTSQELVSVEITPAFVHPTNGAELLTLDINAKEVISKENLDGEELRYIVEIWINDIFLVRNALFDSDGNVDIKFRKSSADCFGSKFTQCVKYYDFSSSKKYKPNENPFVYGPKFGEPGKYRIDLIIEKNPDMSSASHVFGSSYVIDLKENNPDFSPNFQSQIGVSSSQILCKEGFSLIFKSSNHSPACVKPLSVSKLLERGWITGSEILQESEPCLALSTIIKNKHQATPYLHHQKGFRDEIKSMIFDYNIMGCELDEQLEQLKYFQTSNDK